MKTKKAGIQEKRAGPAPVEPLSHNGIRYEALQWGRQRGLDQNGGYIAAIDEETGEELWILKVYQVTYDDDMEGDVQDVFIVNLTLDEPSGRLMVENEECMRYVVDPVTRTIDKLTHN